jgi:hypothetical protein
MVRIFFPQLLYLRCDSYSLMNTKLLATFAIVVASALVGALAAGTIMVAQQASAGGDNDESHHGCAKHSTGYIHSDGKCFHRG